MLAQNFNVQNSRDNGMKKTIVGAVLVAMLHIGCSQSAATPPTPPASAKTQDAANTGSGADSAGAGAAGGLGGLLGGSGQLESDYDVRSRQIKQLTDQRDTYNYQITNYQQFRFQMLQQKDGNDEGAFTQAKAGSLGASLIGGLVGVGGAGLVTAIGAPPSSTSADGSTTTGANPAAGAFATAFSTAGTGIANGIGADDFNKQLKSGTAQVSANIQAQTDQYDAVIANLQAKVAAINAQIDALNAQKLKQ